MCLMFDDSGLLAEITCCVVNLDWSIDIVTKEEKTMHADLVCLVLKV